MAIDGSDREVLRPLAARVREIADSDRNLALKCRWVEHNALRGGEPMVVVWPEGSWIEILPDEALQCRNPLARDFERSLRATIWQSDVLRDDTAIEPWFAVGWSVDMGNFGVESPKRHGDHRGSYAWTPPIGEISAAPDVLRFRQPRVDRHDSQNRLDQANEAFGDLLPARRGGGLWWTLGLTWSAIDLVGLENMMMAMMDEPEALHGLMAFLRDEQAHLLETLEREGLLTSNAIATPICSGGIGCSDEVPHPEGPCQLKHMWGFAESQETVGISPEMFAEFVLPYQIPLLERFALCGYGCCEPVHTRWNSIRTIPGLRRVSVSPWCDQEIMARELGREFVYSRKPNPAPVCVGFDECAIQAELDHTLEVAGECVLEIFLKDTHTVEHEPERLARWVRMARATIERKLG